MRKGPVPRPYDSFYVPEPNTGCWLWTGWTGAAGYGLLKVNMRAERAHRVMWQHLRGPIPEGLVIDHICRVRSCVNPDHLRVVTPRVNALENSDSPSAHHIRKTHCKYGHPFDAANTYRYPTKSARGCRTCHREDMRRRNALARQAKLQPQD